MADMVIKSSAFAALTVRPLHKFMPPLLASQSAMTNIFLIFLHIAINELLMFLILLIIICTDERRRNMNEDFSFQCNEDFTVSIS